MFFILVTVVSGSVVLMEDVRTLEAPRLEIRQRTTLDLEFVHLARPLTTQATCPQPRRG